MMNSKNTNLLVARSGLLLEVLFADILLLATMALVLSNLK